VDEGSIQAKYVDGVLHLSMLKLPQVVTFIIMIIMMIIIIIIIMIIVILINLIKTNFIGKNADTQDN
jgi:hypothetical protein